MYNIRILRDQTGLTQKEFADRFGIPVGTLRRWEYGESKPADYVLRMIANQLPHRESGYHKYVYHDKVYYWDELSNSVIDAQGIKITVREDIHGVKEQNLPLYLNDLFEAYYDAVQRFEFDCKMDKKEDIIWG